MATFSDTIITNLGDALVTKLIAGGQPLNWTRAELSSNQYAAGTDYKALTSLAGVEDTATVNSVRMVDQNTVEVGATFVNDNVDTAFTIWNYGFYATDPDVGEILFSVTPATVPDTMPDKTSGAVFIAQAEYTKSDDLSISLAVDASALVNYLDLSRKVDKVPTAVVNNIVLFDTAGNVKDSGVSLADLATTENLDDYVEKSQIGVPSDYTETITPGWLGTEIQPNDGDLTNITRMDLAGYEQTGATQYLVVARSDNPAITAQNTQPISVYQNAAGSAQFNEQDPPILSSQPIYGTIQDFAHNYDGAILFAVSNGSNASQISTLSAFTHTTAQYSQEDITFPGSPTLDLNTILCVACQSDSTATTSYRLVVGINDATTPLMVFTGDDTITLTEEPTAIATMPTAPVTAISLSPDADLMVVVSDTLTTYQWNGTAYEVVEPLSVVISANHRVAISPNADYLAYWDQAATTNSFKLWKIEVVSGNYTFTDITPTSITSIAASAQLGDVAFGKIDNKMAITYGVTPFVRFYAIETDDSVTEERLANTLQIRGPQTLLYTRDNDYLIVASNLGGSRLRQYYYGETAVIDQVTSYGIPFLDKDGIVYEQFLPASSGGGGGGGNVGNETPLMDGVAAPGISAFASREDHIHPTDTNRAPINHASTATNYGVGTTTLYGHVMLTHGNNGIAQGDLRTLNVIELGQNLAATGGYLDFHSQGTGTITDFDGRISCTGTSGASGGGAMVYNATSHTFTVSPIANTAATTNNQLVRLAEFNSGLNGRAPTNHAVAAATYGIGTAGVWGHVRLTDNYAVNSGAAATGYALSSAGALNMWNAVAKLGTSNTFTAINNFNSITNLYYGQSGMLQLLPNNQSATTNIYITIRPYGTSGAHDLRFQYLDPSIFQQAAPYTIEGSYWSLGRMPGLPFAYVYAGVLTYQSISSGSDERLKKNIVDVDEKIADNFINKLSIKQYEFKNPKQKFIRFGFIAQDLLKVLQESGIDAIKDGYNIVTSNPISEEEKETQGIDDVNEVYSVAIDDILALLTKSVQTKQKKIDELEVRIAKLEEAITTLLSKEA